MNKTIKAALITGIATIIAGFIGGMSYGKSSEQKNIQNEIHSVMGNVINVTGNDNQVTINSVKDLVDEYQRLQSQNKSLLEQNSKYFSDLTEANYQLNALQSKTNELPEIKFNDLSLLIDVQDIPINKNNSMVTIDGRDYFSREIVESLIPTNQNMIIKDDTLFVGRVIVNSSNLFDQWKVDSGFVDIQTSATDSYGNIHENTLVFHGQSSYIVYNIKNQYSLLQCNISVKEDARIDGKGKLIIKADDYIIYTSPTLTKTTKPFKEIDIPLNNCSLLTIEYNRDFRYSNSCLVSDIVLYN